MVKPAGSTCNLGCAYCYYLSKERLYPGSTFRMSDELLEDFTEDYIKAQRVPEVTFGWQGGEPTLMGLDFFRRAVELQEKHRPPGTSVRNTIQTNGTGLSDDWCRFFRQHKFLVGLSMDGPPDLHDAYRRDKGGNPTSGRVIRGAALLREHAVEFNILATVHAANADYPTEVYRFLRDEVGAQFIQFIPIVERENETGFQEGTRLTERSVTGQQYGSFLNAIFDEWVRKDVGRVFVQIFDAALAAWVGEPPGLCIFEETCGTALVLEHNGDLYACDHFVEPRYRLGNVQEAPLTDLVGSDRQRQFGLAKRDQLPRACRECAVQFACHGGCPKNRVLGTRDGEPGLNCLCQGYGAFFRHIDSPMRIMATELKAGRPPANVMQRLKEQDEEFRRRVALAGRNDPCPCGSGRKLKHCHGQSRSLAGARSRTEPTTGRRWPDHPSVDQ
jgi:uncharacterized protein